MLADIEAINRTSSTIEAVEQQPALFVKTQKKLKNEKNEREPDPCPPPTARQGNSAEADCTVTLNVATIVQPGDAIVGPQSGSNNDISQNQHDGDSSRSDSAARLHEQGKRTHAQAFNANSELNSSAPCCQMLNSSIRYQT